MVENNNKNKLRQRQIHRQQKAGTLMVLFLLVVGIVMLLDVSKLKLNYMYSYDDDSSSYNSFLSSSSSTTTTEHSQHHHYKNETEEEGTTSTTAADGDSQIKTNGNHSFNNSIFQQRIDDYFSSLKIQQQTENYYNISWIQNYLVWHDSMRRTYPESTIFNFDNNNNSNKATTTSTTTERNKKKLPKIAIAYMDPQKNQGGLTDRFKGLGHLLWKCYKESRVLFLKWFDAPLQLEEFLLPNLINWTLPQDHINLQSAEKLRISFDDLDSDSDSNNDNDNNNDDDDGSKQRSKNNVRLYTFVSPLGNYKQPFNIIFDAYFQPSQWVQDGIDEAYFNLNLQPGQYDAVHLRIGHPAFRNKKKYDDKSKLFDKYGGGYNFSSLATHDDDDNNNNNSDQKLVVKAINSATRAIECSKYLVQTQQQHFEKLPLYFFSDSIDLIQTVVVDNDHDGMDNKTGSNKSSSAFHHEEGNDSTVLAALGRLKNTTKHYPDRIVGRTDVPIAHLERRHHPSKMKATTTSDISNTAIINEAHKNTFVDLLIASKARCLSLGIGRYAYMARKISSTTQLQTNDSSNDCWIRHAMEADSSTTAQWGMKLMYKEVPKCPTNIG